MGNLVYKNFTFVETSVQAFVAIPDLKILHYQSEIVKSERKFSILFLSPKSCMDRPSLVEIYLEF